MKKLIIAASLVLGMAACSKENYYPLWDSKNPMFGYWKEPKGRNFIIENLTGQSTSTGYYHITTSAGGDSLHVVLLPLVNHHFKIVSVGAANLVLTMKGEEIVYTRSDPNKP